MQVTDSFQNNSNHSAGSWTSSKLYNHTAIKSVACIKLIKKTVKKCFNTKVNIALLQMSYMPFRPGPPSQVTILVNKSIRGLLSRISQVAYDMWLWWRSLQGKTKWLRTMILSKYIFVFTQGPYSSGEPWMHGTIIEHGNTEHSGGSYRICITKTGWIVTGNTGYIKQMPITAEWLIESIWHTQMNNDIYRQYKQNTWENSFNQHIISDETREFMQYIYWKHKCRQQGKHAKESNVKRKVKSG